jgi:hypothetical protein
MKVELEQIRKCVARLFDIVAIADEQLEAVERNMPSLFYYVERKAAGHLLMGRATFIDFLRSMPEPTFDHLFERALDFLRRNERGLEAPETQDPELCALTIVLWFDEQRLDGYQATDGELYALMERLAHLILLEEQTRGGAGVWLAHSPMLLREGAVGPLRFPMVEWITPD